MIPDLWLEQAAARLRGKVNLTPLERDPQRGWWLKWENQQITGSFKLRGAWNKVLSLEGWELERGLVAASAGNHGQGVALAARNSHARAVIFASDQAVPAKVQAMRNLGADVHLVPGGYAEAELAGIEFSRQTGMTWISPYNDGQVIAGQATLGLELLEQVLGLDETQRPDGVLVPIGGGGLLSGIGLAVARLKPRLKLIGVQSDASAYFDAIFHSGSQNGVVEQNSLADGLAGPVEDGAMTIPLVRKLADDICLVSEEQIGQAVAFAWHKYHQKIEGSGAVSLACAMFHQAAGLRRPLVLISGGNIQPEIHAQLCARWPADFFTGADL